MRKLVVILLVLLVSCSAQRQLQNTFVGKDLKFLQENFGQPKTVLKLADEEVYIFETLTELKSTEVSQGRLSLDPIISPKVTKTEIYSFTLKNGVVVKSSLEEKYER